MTNIAPQNLVNVSEDAILEILDVIEYLCKIDIELQLGEEISLKKAIYENDGFNQLEKMSLMKHEDLQMRAAKILEIYVDEKFITEPESDPVHLVEYNAEQQTLKVQIPARKECKHAKQNFLI